jgi:hypothetical protein
MIRIHGILFKKLLYSPTPVHTHVASLDPTEEDSTIVVSTLAALAQIKLF